LEFVKNEFSLAISEARAEARARRSSGQHSQRLLALGIVTGAERDALHLDTLDRVIAPCATALTAWRRKGGRCAQPADGTPT
jgi:hypothetical protein